MNAYMAYSRIAGPEEYAILVLAHNSREAKPLGVAGLRFLTGDADWIDTAVTRCEAHCLALADQVKLAADEPHVIDSPRVCVICELWGVSPLDAEGRCEACLDDMT